MVCKFLYFEVIILTCISVLSSGPEMFCKKDVFTNFSKFIGNQNHSLIDFTHKRDCVCHD